MLSMKIKTLYKCALVALSLLLGSCTDFFSTSLAPWAARDPGSLIPAVNADNVNDLLRLAENDPDMSNAILRKIRDAVNGANSDDRVKLQSAALTAASNASGMGNALLKQAGNISQITEGDAIDLVADMLNDMKNLQEAAVNLEYILPDPGTPAFNEFVDNSNADDLAIAAALLIAASAKDSADSKDYLKTFNDPPGNLSPQEELALKLARAANSKPGDSALSGSLKELLNGLNIK